MGHVVYLVWRFEKFRESADVSGANSVSVKHNTILGNFNQDFFDYGFDSNGINYLVSYLKRAQ